VTITYFVQK